MLFAETNAIQLTIEDNVNGRRRTVRESQATSIARIKKPAFFALNSIMASQQEPFMTIDRHRLV